MLRIAHGSILYNIQTYIRILSFFPLLTWVDVFTTLNIRKYIIKYKIYITLGFFFLCHFVYYMIPKTGNLYLTNYKEFLVGVKGSSPGKTFSIPKCCKLIFKVATNKINGINHFKFERG